MSDRVGWIPAIGVPDGGYVVDLLDPDYLTDTDVMKALGGERIWWCAHSEYRPIDSSCEKFGEAHDECGWRWLVKEEG